MTDSATEMARSFGRAAADYAAGRPTYPAEAVEWMLGPDPLDVVDVGAGTGKLTQAIVAAGHRVTAVEPDPAMLATLTESLPGVPGSIGTGEHLPLPDASVDRVAFGQAWHWVDQAVASREVARVLRPGGLLCLVWNIRDEQVPWVAELGRVMSGSAAERMIAQDDIVLGPELGPLERARFTWVNELTRDQLVQMAASRSYIITATPERRQQVLDGVRALADDATKAPDGERILLPYVTHAFRAPLA